MDDQPNSLAQASLAQDSIAQNSLAQDSLAHDSTRDEPTAEIEIGTAAVDKQDDAAQSITAQALPEATQVETAAENTGSSETASSEAAASEGMLTTSRRAVNKKSDRPFRVKLRGSVLVLVRLPNKRDIRAAIHQLSVTGGVVHLEKPLDEKLGVEMIFHIGGATLREKAQMLFPMWATQGWMQPFRFVAMSDASREALDAHLKEFMGEPAKAKGAAAGA